MKIITTVAIFCLLGVSFALAAPAEAPEAPVVPVEVPKEAKTTIPTTNEKILLTFKDPRMIKVLTCESQLKQFKVDGTPLVSPTSDVGIAQINRIHWSRAKELGLDIFNNEDDNLKMAKIIYDEQGIEAWSAFQNACYYKV
jgi:hypothetical protein